MAASAVGFIQIIEEYPCLYNNRIPEYSRKDVTDQAWSEVAFRTNTSVTACQNKWKNIRNGFVRSLKPTADGSSTKQKKPYYLHDELQFVLPFVKAAIYTDDFELNLDPPDSLNGLNTDQAETSTSEPVPSSTKKPKITKSPNEADRDYKKWLKNKGKTPDNSRKMFLLSLMPDIDNLTEYQMRQFRIKMLLLMEEIRTGSSMEQQYSDQYRAIYSPTTSTPDPLNISHNTPANYSVKSEDLTRLQLENFSNM